MLLLIKRLELIFQWRFPTERKKANVVLAHKKGDKQNSKNYRPIFLLSVVGKLFERILCNKHVWIVYGKQSGFIPRDSCISKHLFITHEIYKSFDDDLEVQGIFLYISKIYDKLWHEGLLNKLKQNDISGKLFDIITDFLDFTKLRVFSNGQYSSYGSI